MEDVELRHDPAGRSWVSRGQVSCDVTQTHVLSCAESSCSRISCRGPKEMVSAWSLRMRPSETERAFNAIVTYAR